MGPVLRAGHHPTMVHSVGWDRAAIALLCSCLGGAADLDLGPPHPRRGHHHGHGGGVAGHRGRGIHLTLAILDSVGRSAEIFHD